MIYIASYALFDFSVRYTSTMKLYTSLSWCT
jgi:hypothetical protein